MEKKISKNYIYNLIYQILLVISPVITIPFLSRSLGVEGIGQYSYAYAITSFFVLFASLGCDVYGRREISYLLNKPEERTMKFYSIQIIKVIFTLITMVVYIIYMLNSKNKILLGLLIFHLINVPFNIGWFFQGIEEFKKITLRGIVLKIIDLFFVIFFIKKPSDLNIYVLGSSFISFIAFFVLWFDIKKYLVKVNIKKIKIKYDFKNCLIFFIPTVATTIYTLIDKTMLELITKGYIANGYYEQTLKINIVLLRIVLALGLVLLPKISLAYQENKKEEIEKYIKLSMRYMFMISLAFAFGLFCISDIFVPWFFGSDFLEVASLLKASGFILVFQGINDVIGIQYMVSVGRQKEYIKSLGIGTIFNIIFNIFFIYKYNALGAIIASIIGEATISVIQCYIIRKEINLKDIFSSIEKYLFASIIMSIILLIVKSRMSANILNTIILVFLGGGIYLTTLIFLKDKLIIYIIEKLKLVIINKFSKNEGKV